MKIYDHSYKVVKGIPKLDYINRSKINNVPVYDCFIWEDDKGICRMINYILFQVGTYISVFDKLYIIKEMCISNVTDIYDYNNNRIVYDYVVAEVNPDKDKGESL